MIVVFLGAPGTGKGSQAKLLLEEFDLKQVSTGEILREEIKKDTDLGKLAKLYLDKGELVPNEIILGIIENLLNNSDKNKAFIFDGFPRTMPQAKEFDNLLKKISISLDFVLYFQTSRESLIKRLASRRICSKCSKDYNLIINPSLNGSCDQCGSEVIQREDDKEEVISRRMEVYESQTAPLIEYYSKQGKLININCEKGILDIYKEVKSLFENKAESKN